ncbi:MAG: hypothetical protein ACRDJC_04675 [Thermomicrobiales bacterium]
MICHGANTCCREVQAARAADNECCGDLECGNVSALGSGFHCCAGVGEACATHNDCCGGRFCASKEGVCV